MKKLHQKFVILGQKRNKLTYQLLDILPEIFETKIYKKYCETIEEYAGKFAGLSSSVVKKRLNLEKHLENKPALRAAIKTQGVHKVALVARITKPEDDEVMADKVENMSKGALFEMAKEIRHGGEECRAVQKMTIEFDDQMQFIFLNLKKEKGKNLSNKEFMRRLLKEMQKDKFLPGKKSSKNGTKKPSGQKNPSRYIPVEQKSEAIGDGHCIYPGCNNPFQDTHHIEYYSEVHNHIKIVPICNIHHEFAHNGLNIQGKFTLNKKLHKADKLYRKYRQKSLK